VGDLLDLGQSADKVSLGQDQPVRVATLLLLLPCSRAPHVFSRQSPRCFSPCSNSVPLLQCCSDAPSLLLSPMVDSPCVSDPLPSPPSLRVCTEPSSHRSVPLPASVELKMSQSSSSSAGKYYSSLLLPFSSMLCPSCSVICR
jgi:hypothetical protein